MMQGAHGPLFLGIVMQPETRAARLPALAQASFAPSWCQSPNLPHDFIIKLPPEGHFCSSGWARNLQP
ncbi:hypothetical protein G113_07632 [Aeromonas molluscorum 848]|uniref:Uncharacterized protein n=1 Tax=Aeromonas molluscorum 848 TaxID=1268236 RepID=R1HB98_9GAMM|nr:hypothetical protein G113_07632 [Aeromonas molluscorum 848]